MAEKLTHKHDPARDAFDRALFEDPPRYPEGAAFISSEATHLDELLRRELREDRPLVLVFPDGMERVITASPPGASLRSRLLARIRRAYWRVTPDRRRRVPDVPSCPDYGERT